MIGYYYLAVAIAFINFSISMFLSRRRANFYETGTFLVCFLVNLGYLGVALSQNVESALVANKLTPLGGCMVTLMMCVVVLRQCNINTPVGITFALYLYSAFVFFLALTPGYTDWYYKSVELQKVNGVSVLVKEYGWAHNLFYILLVLFVLFSLIALVYAVSRGNQLSIKNVAALTIIQTIIVVVHLVGKDMIPGIDLTPLGYDVVCFFLLYITHKSAVYNLENSIMGSFEKQNDYGYIMFDEKLNYLGASAAITEFMPQLSTQVIDRKLTTWANPLFGEMVKWIEEFKGGKQIHIFRSNNRDYKCVIDNLYHGSKKCGYMIEISDDTKQQEYLRQVEQLAQSRVAFLAKLSHEIRTPINSILGMNELIIRESHEKPIIDYAKKAEEAGATLTGLVNQIIDFTKMESDQIEINRTEYALSSVISFLKEMTELLVVEKKLNFSLTVDDNVPDVLWGDDGKMRQVLSNLLTNAVKYTEKGGIDFYVRSSLDKEYVDKGRITNLQFIIKDTGVGIKPEEMGQLFTPFDGIGNTKKGVHAGTGIGLYIAKQFAELMGGSIAVESAFGEGSTFTFSLDQQVMGKTFAKNASLENVKLTQKRYEVSFKAPLAHILIVDDNKTNLAVAKGLLKKTEVMITTAISGSECIDLLSINNYDLVLLDHMMPNMDGIETLAKIREKHLADNVAVIALTANVLDGAKQYFLDNGFTDYLAKPINYVQLEGMIKKYLPAEKLAIEETELND